MSEISNAKTKIAATALGGQVSQADLYYFHKGIYKDLAGNYVTRVKQTDN